MKVVRAVEALRPGPRALAVGTFDGVHVGHRRAVQNVLASGLPLTAVVVETREAPVLTTVERRLELLAELGVDEALVGKPEVADPAVHELGADTVVAVDDMDLARSIRDRIEVGDVDTAAELLGRPPELEGVVVAGDARGAGLGFPTANLAVPPELVVPARGIYAGAADGHRAATSIGVNPHYGGADLRVETFLLDFDGDLYGRRLRIELWRRLRDERAFASEEDLVAQIARDVDATREAVRPV